MRTGLSNLGSFMGGEPETSISSSSGDYLDGIIGAIESGVSRDEADLHYSGYRTLVKPWDSTADNSYVYEALASPPQLTITTPSDRPYTLVLDGFGVLPNWVSASWVSRVNAPDELEIEYPADQEFAMDLKRPNTLSLFTGEGLLIQSFDFVNALPDVSRDGGTLRVKAKAESRLCRLRSAWVEFYAPGGSRVTSDITETDTAIILPAGQGVSYSSGDDILLDNERMTVASVSGDTLTVTRGQQSTPSSKHSAQTLVIKARSIASHVRELLKAYPVDGFPVSVAMIDPALESVVVAVSFENVTLLDAINQLWTLSGMSGMFQVTNSGRFAWIPALGGTGAITLGVNLLTVDRTVDDSNLCTRLYIYGSGASRESRVKLSDLSGGTVDYVEANTASYGIIPQSVVLSGIKDAATLKTVADAYIAIMSEPYLSYSATAADLEALGVGVSPTIGSNVAIDDSELGISTTESVLAIDHDLSDPSVVKYTFAKYSYDLADVIDNLASQLAAEQTRDIAAELSSELSGAGESGNYDSPFASGLSDAWGDETGDSVDVKLEDPRMFSEDQQGMKTKQWDEDKIGVPLLWLERISELPEKFNAPCMAYCAAESIYFLYDLTNERWVSLPWIQNDDPEATTPLNRGYYDSGKGVPAGFTHFLFEMPPPSAEEGGEEGEGV